LEVGRTTRVVQAAQRTALAVRDSGCVFPGWRCCAGRIIGRSTRGAGGWSARLMVG
jgi:hypothetical protein